jgi:GNAT superfamily N-acetyltransferase
LAASGCIRGGHATSHADAAASRAMTVTIRPARAAEAEILPDIERDAGRSFLAIPDLAWIASDQVTPAEDHRARIAGGTVWIAEDGAARLVGFLNAEVTGDALHIWELAVRREAQQQGVGARLLGAAIDHARTAGLRAVTLTTFRDVPWNAPFYARNGFAILAPAEFDARLGGLLDQETAWGMSGRCAMRLVLG